MTEKLTPVCEGYACCQQTVICGCVCYLKTFMKWAGILLWFLSGGNLILVFRGKSN